MFKHMNIFMALIVLLVTCHYQAIIMALQTLVSRNTVPTEAAVVSVTKVHGGDANNVIPGTVSIGGTYRALKPEIFDWLKASIEEKVKVR